jgi:hypothetical protein
VSWRTPEADGPPGRTRGSRDDVALRLTRMDDIVLFPIVLLEVEPR